MEEIDWFEYRKEMMEEDNSFYIDDYHDHRLIAKIFCEFRKDRLNGMKKIINDPNNVVSEMLQALSIANPDVNYFPGVEVIARKHKSEKVGIVSGGGSGHIGKQDGAECECEYADRQINYAFGIVESRSGLWSDKSGQGAVDNKADLGS